MTERPMGLAVASRPAASTGDVPPPEVVAFIRFCHRRRHAGWPELYDEMCAVAARREFKGWGIDQLAEHGVTFTLLDMARLAGWVRAVLAGQDKGAKPGAHHGAGTPRQTAQAVSA
jgi:hypothetical protein